jgi:putative addiction module component (TIGR02574 family)
MSIDQITAEALQLPPKERAFLAESLWESLSDPFEVAPDDHQSVTDLATERDLEIESGQVQVVSHEDVMSRLR